MITFLTSHIGGSYKVDGYVLIISANPDSMERNDSIRDIFAEAFPMSDFSTNEMVICDRRNEDVIKKLPEYDVVILAGGHVPTQNGFVKKIGLKEKLEEFDGILIGISAGTMNCAEIVYAQPELEGESIDDNYQRFISGLGITELMILPHYQDIKDDILDGKRLFEDITYSDSYGREFYALVDGSYVMLENGETTIWGKTFLIKDGSIRKICDRDECVDITKEGF